MRQVFKIAKFDDEGKLTLFKDEFLSYADAEKAITEDLAMGIYQIQKVFVKE